MEERIELKFLLDLADYHNLKRQLDLFMKEDEFQTHDHGYRLSSLYFDDMYDSATHDKADGVEYHRKFRIRMYEDGRKRLEYKIKNGNLTMKETLVLDDDMEKALVGRDYSMIEKKLDLPLIKELFLKMKVDNLEVRQYVDYFREIYIFNNNEVRITFDRDLMVYNVANPNQKYKILEPNQIIMEVKYRKYLPDTIRKIVFQKHYHPIPYSKYLMGWLKLNNWGV